MDEAEAKYHPLVGSSMAKSSSAFSESFFHILEIVSFVNTIVKKMKVPSLTVTNNLQTYQKLQEKIRNDTGIIRNHNQN